jgi:hypothetical protein
VKYHGVLAPCAGWRDRVVLDPVGGVRSVLLCAEGTGSSGPAPVGRGEDFISAAGRATPGAASEEPPVTAADELGASGVSVQLPGSTGAPVDRPRHPNRSWAELMRRTFEMDVMECPCCGGRLRLLAAILDPAAVRAILDCFRLPSRPPPGPSLAALD